MANEFITKPEIIFIVYDEIIKNPYPFILNQIKTLYRNVYEEFIDFNLIDGKNMDQLLNLCILRRKKNIFYYLAKKDFNYKKALDDIFYKFNDMYIKSNPLIISSSIKVLLKQKFTEKIYIYTEKYDKRVHLDIQQQFQDMDKVNYVTGDFYNTIKKLGGITTFILKDILNISTILYLDKIQYTNILVGNFGFNFTLSETGLVIPRFNVDDIMADKIFKFATFNVYN